MFCGWDSRSKGPSPYRVTLGRSQVGWPLLRSHAADAVWPFFGAFPRQAQGCFVLKDAFYGRPSVRIKGP